MRSDGAGVENPQEGGEFAIEAMADRHLPEVLAALTGAFGPGFDETWFKWKHRQSPSGESPSWVAIDEAGVLGVRLLLPWTFQDGTTIVKALRPCDTVTLPRARRRGVFQALTDEATRSVTGSADLLFNTPNEKSRPGYFKMGFQVWTTVHQRVGPVLRSGASLVTGASALPPFIERTGLATRSDPASLTWRYLSIPHRTYEIAALREADSPTGAIYRLRHWRGMRLLVMSELWGSRSARRTLLRAIARKEHSSLVRAADDQRGASLFGLAGSSTLVTHKPLGTGSFSPPTLSIGDIEDVL